MADRRDVAPAHPLPPAGSRLSTPVFRAVLIAAVALVAAPGRGQQPAMPVAKPWDAVLICSFNIQVFGEAKMAKREVVEVLARVARKFDIVAIQEVRAKSDEVVPSFVRAVNADGSQYHYVIGPREGRTVSKEQYTFVYDTRRIEVDASSLGVVPNPSNALHRPPMHVRFRTRIQPAEMAFTFWLVDIHTDPDEVPSELQALSTVFQQMQALRPDEDDVIVLGDLNAGPPQFTAFKRIPGIGWAVSGTTTNTRRSKTYDNLIFSQPQTSEYLGTWGVFDLQNAFGLPLDKALEVSDHNPVWAAFYPAEHRGQSAGFMAAQPATVR